MPGNSLTLYKLMIMYMLDHVAFPLTTSQLSEFFVSKKYTSYFHLQQCIHELTDDSFIRGESKRSYTRFYLTDTGKGTIELLEEKIPDPIRDDILRYFKENISRLRREVDITADYFPTEDDEYTVKAQVRERGSLLLEMSINVVSEDQAITICDRWPGKSEEIYNIIMKSLLLDKPEG